MPLRSVIAVIAMAAVKQTSSNATLSALQLAHQSATNTNWCCLERAPITFPPAALPTRRHDPPCAPLWPISPPEISIQPRFGRSRYPSVDRTFHRRDTASSQTSHGGTPAQCQPCRQTGNRISSTDRAARGAACRHRNTRKSLRTSKIRKRHRSTVQVTPLEHTLESQSAQAFAHDLIHTSAHGAAPSVQLWLYLQVLSGRHRKSTTPPSIYLHGLRKRTDSCRVPFSEFRPDPLVRV